MENATTSAGPDLVLPRACSVCAISKAKCVPRPNSENGKCERCHRLKKECLPGQPFPKRPRQKRTTRADQLEQKLEGLVSLLTAQRSPQLGVPVAGPSQTLIDQQTSAPPTPMSRAPTPQIWTSISPAQNAWTPSVSHQEAPALSPVVFSQSATTVDDLLRTFQAEFARLFPFVVIPPGLSAQDLISTKPVLSDVVWMVVQYRDPIRQLEMKTQNMRTISEQMLIQGIKNMDLLQAILFFLAWYQHFLGSAPQLTNLLHLAQSLMYDLGIHKPSRSTETESHEVFVEAIKTFNGKLLMHPRTLEERRAFLGIWYHTSILSTNIRKVESLRYTPWVDDCCCEIEKQQEYQSDLDLVNLVRLQLIAEKSRSLIRSGLDPTPDLSAVPIGLYANSLKEELEKFKTSLPPHLIQNVLFQLSIHSTTIQVYEISLHRRSTSTDPYLNTSLQRLSLLFSCLRATTAFFNLFLSIPTSDFPQLPFTIYSRAAHAAVVLSKLNLFVFEGWDLAVVQKEAPFSIIIEKTAQKYEEASRSFNTRGATDAYWKIGQKVRRLLEWYDARLAGMEQLGMEQKAKMPLFPITPESSVYENSYSFDEIDERLWDEFMGCWSANGEVP